jgi:hypothetical protein
LKQLQEVVENTLEHIGIGKDFLSRIQKVQHLRERMNKWYCIKIKSFCIAKEIVIESIDCPQNGRKPFPAIRN